MSFRPFRSQLLLAVLGFAVVGLSSSAGALSIIGSPQETTGPYRYNVFHTAGSNGGVGGNVKAWFDLDLAGVNDYDPVTGALSASFNIYTDSSLTTLIGTASAVGVGLVGDGTNVVDLGDNTQNNAVVGTITWSFNLPVVSALRTYIGGKYALVNNMTTVTTSFADVQYVTSTNGRTANTFDGQYLTLWGADGTFSGSTIVDGNAPGGKGGFGSTADLGVDLVLEVPEPTAILMFAAGALGLLAIGRRVDR